MGKQADGRVTALLVDTGTDAAGSPKEGQTLFKLDSSDHPGGDQYFQLPHEENGFYAQQFAMLLAAGVNRLSVTIKTDRDIDPTDPNNVRLQVQEVILSWPPIPS
jgi:hypothetical protein